MTTPETSTSRALASSWEWRLDLPEGWLEIPGGITGASHDLAAWERGATAVVRESLEPAPDDDLMAALGATGGYPAAPPAVEYPDMPDGDGVRVIRLDIGEETGGAWMSVGLGRRTEHPDAVVDTVLVWRTQDLLLGTAMVELLDQLMPAVRIDQAEA